MSPRRQSQLADRVEEFSLQLVVRKSGMHNQHRWHAIELCGYRFAAETNRSKHGYKSRDKRRLRSHSVVILSVQLRLAD